MLRAAAAIAVTALTASALIFAAMKCYERIFAPRTDGHGLSGLVSPDRLRRLYDTAPSAYSPWTVVYISIYEHRLESTADYSDVLAVDALVRKSIEKAVARGLFDAATVLDGRNYALLTRADDAGIRNFCNNFMVFDKTAGKGAAQRLASLLSIHVGAYSPAGSGIGFDDAVAGARRAAKYALETHTKFCLSNYDVQTQIGEMELIEREVDSRIDNKEFYMVIQPFMGKNGEVIGGETLSRFRLKDGRDVPVHKYLRAIRKMELYGRFDYAVFERCLSWLTGKAAERTGIVSCNFTRFTVASPDFLKNFCAILDKYKVNENTIGIEITEDEGVLDRKMLIENIRAIKRMGFLIFIDDFGSGAASLDDLYDIPVDVLKLDKSLLRRADTEKGRVIFEGVCAIAAGLGIKVLCEGIETGEQAAYVDKLGCDIRQGFYFHRPMLMSEFEELCGGKEN